MANNVKEKIKLDQAYINYHNIIDKKLVFKFAYLDEWLLKNSKLLLAETEVFESKANSNKYKTIREEQLLKLILVLIWVQKCHKYILQLY